MHAHTDPRPLSRIYAYFSFGLACMFFGFYFFEEQLNWWQSPAPKILPIALSAYMAMAIANLIKAYRYAPVPSESYHITLLTEILSISFLLLFLAPKQWDLALILLLNVGLASTLVKQRFGYFLAAMATIMVLSHTWIHGDQQVTDQLLSSTLISILFFLEVFVIQGLKVRLSEAQSEARDSQSRLLSVARINDIIIERMQTGVCLVDHTGTVLRVNRAGQERLGNIKAGVSLPLPIAERLIYWQHHQLQNLDTVDITQHKPDAQPIIINFANIDARSTLIFIEDKDTITRRASQFKLSSMARMAASIAHEIRNPLNAISHAAQLLEESPQLNHEDQELCDIIINQSSRMESIIQNVLQISKRKTSTPQWLNLNGWLKQFEQDFCHQYPVAIKLDVAPADIRFDPSQFHQVMWNICLNAIHYGGASLEEPIFLHSNEHMGVVSLFIQDSGPGVSNKEEEFLFEPFHTTSAQGTGLGLYLAKELCEANQAKIRYHKHQDLNTAPTTGACFEIRFAQT
ncbi:sensor histidine kinase [Bermanella sp. R86510]|uniref:sensor histidine kinase n=1 Tax=unclassified Bermanella TaxID=2627862 RepID=UPI0037C96B14